MTDKPIEYLGLTVPWRTFPAIELFSCKWTRDFYPDDLDWSLEYRDAITGTPGDDISWQLAHVDYQMIARGIRQEAWAALLDELCNEVSGSSWDIYNYGQKYLGPLVGPAEISDNRPDRIRIQLSSRELAIMFKASFAA